MRRAGTVHLGGSLDEISASEWGAWRGRPAERPFVLLAQTNLFDPTRASATHRVGVLPRATLGRDLTDRIEAQVERFAPAIPRGSFSPAHDGRPSRGAQPNLVGET